MLGDTDNYHTSLVEQLDTYLSTDDVEDICFELGVDFENLAGSIKRARIRSLMVQLAQEGRLQALVDAARRRLPNRKWDDVPPNFEEEFLSSRASGADTNASFHQEGQTVHGPQFNAGGDISVGHVGPKVDTDGGDYIHGNKTVIYQTVAGAPSEQPKPRQSFEPPTVLVSSHDLPDFKISPLITNAQYSDYLRSTKNRVPPELGWVDGTSPSVSQREEPVTGVTWYEAMDYCQWLTKRTGRAYQLPSEGQWERAVEMGDIVKDTITPIRQWTTTLWGHKRFTPDPRYAYPWRAGDGRDDSLANEQVRRVVREGHGGSASRGSELPGERGSKSRRVGFRVVEVP